MPNHHQDVEKWRFAPLSEIQKQRLTAGQLSQLLSTVDPDLPVLTYTGSQSIVDVISDNTSIFLINV